MAKKQGPEDEEPKNFYLLDLLLQSTNFKLTLYLLLERERERERENSRERESQRLPLKNERMTSINRKRKGIYEQ